jgi:hypothetical protein
VFGGADPEPGLTGYTPEEIFLGKHKGPSRHGWLGTGVQGISNVLGAGVEFGAQALGAAFDPAHTLLTFPGRIGEVYGHHLEGPAETLLGEANPFRRGDGVPSSGGGQRLTALRAQEEELTERQNRLQAMDFESIPYHLREQYRALEQQTTQEIEQIAEDIEVLTRKQEGIQENFDFGTKLLEALGLPSTLETVRDDPDIAAALKLGEDAVRTGDPAKIDAAVDAYADLSEEELNDLSRAFGREQYLGEMNLQIKNEIHNLIQNRTDLEESLLLAEDMMKNEAQAQQLNLWSTFSDPTPNGRGMDVVTAHLEPWVETNFIGRISDVQWDGITQVIATIWATMPSQEEAVDEEGNIVITGGFTDNHRASLMALATTGLEGIPGLGFTQEKAIAFTEIVEQAIERGLTAAAEAENWKTQESLEPGSAGMATAIAEMAEELYATPEEAEVMANSYYLHRLIQIRSNGDANTQKGGNQSGLGALPEHTYRDLGFNPETILGDVEAQLKALLTFIGYEYGPGIEGLQAALADLAHNPEGWGNLGGGF